MARLRFRNPKIALIICLGLALLSGTIILLTLGVTSYYKEYQKVSNYREASCLVVSSTYKSYQCRTRYSSYICYGSMWYVHYVGDLSVNATVETDHRYDSRSVAIERNRDYQVIIGFK